MILLVKMKDQSVHFALTLDTPPSLDKFSLWPFIFQLFLFIKNQKQSIFY